MSGLSAHGKPAMIFDAGNPTGGDSDLRTPSITGGVGNTTALHNVLILSEDGDTGGPKD